MTYHPTPTDTSIPAVLAEIHKQLDNAERPRDLVTLTLGQPQALLDERDALLEPVG